MHVCTGQTVYPFNHCYSEQVLNFRVLNQYEDLSVITWFCYLTGHVLFGFYQPSNPIPLYERRWLKEPQVRNPNPRWLAQTFLSCHQSHDSTRKTKRHKRGIYSTHCNAIRIKSQLTLCFQWKLLKRICWDDSGTQTG